MGVQGLLPMLKSVMDQVNIAKYRGKIAGIDASGWLYKGCYSCAQDIVEGKETDVYMNFCMEQIRLLQEHDVKPFFVFDGAPLPAKAELNATRAHTREMWKSKAIQAIKNGDESLAFSASNKAVSVSNAMVMKFIRVLRSMNIPFCVAPYEADAQLAYLSRIKLVDIVISEDSDCIPYGCRTVLFKWSADGWASELKRRSLGANEDLSFVGWDEEMFIQMCVLCGCDYCPSVPGIGIVTAYKIINEHRKPSEVLRALQVQKATVLVNNYAEKFLSAMLTFRHHLVFDPRDKKLKMLNPLSISGDLPALVDNQLRFLGNMELKDDVVASIANANIHPTTHDSYAWQETAAIEISKLAPSVRSMTSSETSSFVALTNEEDGDVANAHAMRARRQRVIPDHEPVRAPTTSWSHLDSVLGTSSHILNFRSPKVSENFRPLVSVGVNRPTLQSCQTADRLKEFEKKPIRENLKRVRNPQNRKRTHPTSGFDGEVSCRADTQNPQVLQKARRRKSELEGSSWKGDGSSVKTKVGLAESSAPIEPKYSWCSRLRSEDTPRTSMLATPQMCQPHYPTLLSGENENDGLWQLTATTSSLVSSVFHSRASYAEEKWDRILENEIEEKNDIDYDDSDRSQLARPGSSNLLTCPTSIQEVNLRP